MLCDLTDIEALRQIDLPDDDPVATRLIEMAQGKLEAITGRSFAVVTEQGFRIEDTPEEDGTTFLPTYPITELVVVDSADEPVDPAHYHLDPYGKLYRLGGAGTGIMTWDWQYNTQRTVNSRWPGGTVFVVTGGADDPALIPWDLRTLCAEIAVGLYDAGTVPQGLQSESLQGWSASYRDADPSGSSLSREQMAVVRKYSHDIPVVAW